MGPWQVAVPSDDGSDGWVLSAHRRNLHLIDWPRLGEMLGPELISSSAPPSPCSGAEAASVQQVAWPKPGPRVQGAVWT